MKRQKLGSRQQRVLDVIPESWTPRYVIMLSDPTLGSYVQILNILKRLVELGYVEKNEKFDEVRKVK